MSRKPVKHHDKHEAVTPPRVAARLEGVVKNKGTKEKKKPENAGDA